MDGSRRVDRKVRWRMWKIEEQEGVEDEDEFVLRGNFWIS